MNWLRELKKYLWDDPVVRSLLIALFGVVYGSGLWFKHLPNLGILSLSVLFFSMVILVLIVATIITLIGIFLALHIQRDGKQGA